jgi:hypothetical protein
MSGVFILVSIVLVAVVFFGSVRYSNQITKNAESLEKEGKLKDALAILQPKAGKDARVDAKIAEIEIQLHKNRKGKDRKFKDFPTLNNSPEKKRKPISKGDAEAVQDEVREEILGAKIMYADGLTLYENGYLELALQRFEAIKNLHDFANLRIAEVKLKMAMKLTNTDFEKAISLVEDILGMRKRFEYNTKVIQNKYEVVVASATKFTTDFWEKKITAIYLNEGLDAGQKALDEFKNKYNLDELKIAETKLKIAKKILYHDLYKANILLKEILAMSQIFNNQSLSTRVRNRFKEIQEESDTLRINIFYEKVIKLYKKGAVVEALEKLELIKDTNKYAALKIAEIHFEIAEAIEKTNIGKAIIAYKGILTVQKNIKYKSHEHKELFKAIEQKATVEIINLYYEQGQNLLSNAQFDLAAQSFKDAINFCNYKTSELKEKCSKAIQQAYYQGGIKGEKGTDLNEAIEFYQMALKYFDKIDYNLLYLNIQARIEICYLKKGLVSNVKKIHQLAQHEVSFKKDLIFRLALHYAKFNRIEDSLKVMNTYFTNNQSAEVLKLRNYCNNYYRQTAIENIEIINRAIVGNGKDLVVLSNNFEKILSIIKQGLPELYEKAEKIKRYIFGALLNLYLEKRDSVQIIKHINARSDFYENPELLRIAGVACFQTVENKKITMDNYEGIITTWFSMIGSPIVILSFLEKTPWADNYRFTLIDYASNLSTEYIPNNVNYAPASKDNISIAEIQKQFINSFETIFYNLPNWHFTKEMQKFYQIKKEEFRILTSF